MDAAHVSFNVLKGVEKKLDKKIIFISEQTSDRAAFFKWIPLAGLRQIFYQVLKAFDMLRHIPNSKKFDAIFIFEHKPWYNYLLYFKCIIIGKPVFFIVHGLQQTYKKSLLHRLGFKVLLFLEKRYNFWPVHLEISDHDVQGVTCFSKSIVIPHPLPKISYSKKPDGKIRVGIVGLIRPDKPLRPLLEILAKYSSHQDIEIIIGTGRYSIGDESIDLPFKMVDTSSYEEYYAFISSLHIVVNNFEKDQYYFRPSGIINDAIAAGCFVIAPNYPVFKAQITNPVTLGKLFNNLEEIPNLIRAAIGDLNKQMDDLPKWINFRSDDKIINLLAVKMLQVMNNTNDES